MSIYLPDAATVDKYAAELATKHDKKAMLDRIERAREILHANAYTVDRAGFIVYSQSHTGECYTIDSRGCTCTDYAKHAPMHNGRPWCKHSIAIGIYKKILIDAIAARVLGNGSHHNQRRQRDYPHTYLLIVGDSTLWAENAGQIARVTWSRKQRGYIPADLDSWIALAEWLAHAQPLPAPPAIERTAADAMPAYLYDWTYKPDPFQEPMKERSVVYAHR